jgi:hypothetical protein
MIAMSDKATAGDGAREFYTETNFQKQARRPGGIARDQAVKNAVANIEMLKPSFEDWLNEQINALVKSIPKGGSIPAGLSWIDAADINSQRLADVAATMDYRFMSFVAKNLSLIFDAIRNGAEYRGDVIECHINALRLSRQQQYRELRSEDLPELSEGLRRILESPRL